MATTPPMFAEGDGGLGTQRPLSPLFNLSPRQDDWCDSLFGNRTGALSPLSPLNSFTADQFGLFDESGEGGTDFLTFPDLSAPTFTSLSPLHAPERVDGLGAGSGVTLTPSPDAPVKKAETSEASEVEKVAVTFSPTDFLVSSPTPQPVTSAAQVLKDPVQPQVQLPEVPPLPPPVIIVTPAPQQKQEIQQESQQDNPKKKRRMESSESESDRTGGGSSSSEFESNQHDSESMDTSESESGQESDDSSMDDVSSKSPQEILDELCGMDEGSICQRIAQEVRDSLPCYICFPMGPQFPSAPGASDHVGQLVGFRLKLFTPKCKHALWEFGIGYHDPLYNIRKVSRVHPTNGKDIKGTTADIVANPRDRQYRIFSLNAFTSTCYYHWDALGSLSPTTHYKRDGTERCTLQRHPNNPASYSYIDEIFPNYLRRLSPGFKEDVNTMNKIALWLSTNDMPTPNRAIFVPEGFDTRDFELDERSRSNLLGRGTGTQKGRKAAQARRKKTSQAVKTRVRHKSSKEEKVSTKPLLASNGLSRTSWTRFRETPPAPSSRPRKSKRKRSKQGEETKQRGQKRKAKTQDNHTVIVVGQPEPQQPCQSMAQSMSQSMSQPMSPFPNPLVLTPTPLAPTMSLMSPPMFGLNAPTSPSLDWMGNWSGDNQLVPLNLSPPLFPQASVSDPNFQLLPPLSLSQDGQGGQVGQDGQMGQLGQIGPILNFPEVTDVTATKTEIKDEKDVKETGWKSASEFERPAFLAPPTATCCVCSLSRSNDKHLGTGDGYTGFYMDTVGYVCSTCWHGEQNAWLLEKKGCPVCFMKRTAVPCTHPYTSPSSFLL